MNICIYICIYMYTHMIHTYTYTYTYIHIYPYIYIYQTKPSTQQTLCCIPQRTLNLCSPPSHIEPKSCTPLSRPSHSHTILSPMCSARRHATTNFPRTCTRPNPVTAVRAPSAKRLATKNASLGIVTRLLRLHLLSARRLRQRPLRLLWAWTRRCDSRVDDTYVHVSTLTSRIQCKFA